MAVLTAASTEEWQGIASRSFVPLECWSPTTTFEASIRDLALGSHANLCDIRSSPTVVTRTPRLASGSVNDDVHFSVQVSAHGAIQQGLRRVAVAPGSVSLYATDRPYELDYSPPGQRLIVMQIARSALGLDRAAIDRAVQAIEVADSRARRTFISYVRSLVSIRDEGDSETREDLARIAADLAYTMLRTSESGRPVVPHSPEPLLITIQTFIRDRARQPGLTVDDIARAHYISRRTLYNLFETVGATPSDYLRDERLRLASAMLRDETLTLSVGQVGLSCGFADPTTFTRTFRTRYRMTPKDWRGSRK